MLEILPLEGPCCGSSCLFSPLSEEVEFLLFDWHLGTLLQSQWGVLGLCALCEADLHAPAE
jgi:hypothetical protein